LEILRETPALGSLILTGETNRLTSEIQMNRQQGMTLMDDSLLALVKNGRITNEEAYLKALDKNRFQNKSERGAACSNITNDKKHS
jgi:twitching motility protein PilT